MPLIYGALEGDNPIVLEKALKVVPGLSETLDYTVSQPAMYPQSHGFSPAEQDATDCQVDTVPKNRPRLFQDDAAERQSQASLLSSC